MTEPDIVTELDDWLTPALRAIPDRVISCTLPASTIQRARDELVALHLELSNKRLLKGVRIRHDALEEAQAAITAVKAPEHVYNSDCFGTWMEAITAVHDAILALKDKERE